MFQEGKSDSMHRRLKVLRGDRWCGPRRRPKLVGWMVLGWLTMCASPAVCRGQGAAEREDRPAPIESVGSTDAADSAEMVQGDAITAAQLDAWIAQLGDASYHRRIVAMRKLESAGRAAIEPLERAVLGGNLEVVDRASYLLQTLAADEQPDDPPMAWSALQRLKQRGPGSAAMRADSSLEAIRDDRSERAQTRLAAAGLKVGLQQVSSNINLQADVANAIRFPKDWEFDPEALRWMPWMYSTTMVILEGGAVTDETMAAVVQLPNLVDIQIENAKLSSKGFRELAKLDRIDSLEMHFVDVGGVDEDFYTVLQLPLRKLLVLTATRFDEDDVAAFRTQFSGLEIIFSRGGFLGVRGAANNGPCIITDVVANSAADRAGLRPRDTIIKLGEVEIERFSDLQEAIRAHAPDSEVEVEYVRDGETRQTVVELGRL